MNKGYRKYKSISKNIIATMTLQDKCKEVQVS